MPEQSEVLHGIMREIEKDIAGLLDALSRKRKALESTKQAISFLSGTDLASIGVSESKEPSKKGKGPRKPAGAKRTLYDERALSDAIVEYATDTPRFQTEMIYRALMASKQLPVGRTATLKAIIRRTIDKTGLFTRTGERGETWYEVSQSRNGNV